MSLQTDNIKKSLKLLGLSNEEIELYLALLAKSPESALELSRKLSIGRTKVYRLLDLLQTKGLVNTLVDEYGNKFEANPPTQIELLLKEKEVELEKLKSNAPKIIQELESLQPQAFGETKVVYYKGVEGLKQITWNSLKAKDGIRIYEISNMEGFLDKEFSEKVRFELLQRKIFDCQLTNLTYSPPFTIYSEYVRNYWDYRYIDPKILNIQIETLVYNDTYAMYSYEEGEIFGVEIHNKKLAQMQKQIFDIVFATAKKITIVSDAGEAKLL
jgi:sugar-specific transcriptional regulator TrmB